MLTSKVSLNAPLFGKRKNENTPPPFTPKPKLEVKSKGIGSTVSLFGKAPTKSTALTIRPIPTPLPPPISVTSQVISLLDEWILRLNGDMVEEIARELKNPYRPSNLFVLVGCPGSGKSVVVEHLAKKLKFTCHIYDEYLDHGNCSEENGNKKGKQKEKKLKKSAIHRRHPCSGALMDALLSDSNPTIFVLDHWTPNHEPFLKSFIREYDILQAHIKGLNKTVFVLLHSLDNFAMRDWVRTVKAPKYFMKSYLTYQQQETLWQMVNNRLPRGYSSLPTSFLTFTGDFRRLGMELVGEYHNVLAESANKFEITRHFLSWPQEPLRKPLQGPDTKSLRKMIQHNFTSNLLNISFTDRQLLANTPEISQAKRHQLMTETNPKKAKELRERFEKYVKCKYMDVLADNLSTYDVVRMKSEDDYTGILVNPGIKCPTIQTDSLPLYALGKTLYEMNLPHRQLNKMEFYKPISQWTHDKSCVDMVRTEEEIQRLFLDGYDAMYERMVAIPDCVYAIKADQVKYNK
jgi:adenylate kinase family enzyme